METGRVWTVLAGEIARAYAAFTPGRLRVVSADPDGLCAHLDSFGGAEWKAEVDQYLVAGRIDDLRRRPHSSRYDDITLEPVDAATAPAFTDRACDDLTVSTPEASLWATPQSLDDLTDHAANGMLFGIHGGEAGASGTTRSGGHASGAPADDDLMGVVAATRDDAHGMTGFNVQEIILGADHRGRGLGGAVLQHLLDALQAASDDVLWGTIHPDNQASLRNALGVGREIVGGYVWITPPGWRAW